MAVEVHVTGRVELGRFGEFVAALGPWAAHRAAQERAPMRVYQALSGQMNEVRMVFEYPNLAAYEAEEREDAVVRSPGRRAAVRRRHARVRDLCARGAGVVEVRSLQRAEAFVTKDGSTIRELLGLSTSELVRNQSLAEATLVSGQATERHHHRESEEIYLLLEGGGLMEVDGETREVGPGDSVLVPPGAWHTLRAGSEGARLLCCCAPPYRHEDTFFD